MQIRVGLVGQHRCGAAANTPTVEAPNERIFEFMFPRLGYAIETVLRCLASGEKLDAKDYYEDALLCEHIDLATERVLVTNDRKVIGALSRAHARWIRHAEAERVYASPAVRRHTRRVRRLRL